MSENSEGNTAIKLEEAGYPQDMEATIEAPPRTLTAQERCDRCGSQAYLAVEVGGVELLFCAHHAKKNIDKLTEVGTITLDETAKLTT